MKTNFKMDHQPRWMVVDDDRAVLQLTAMLLQRMGEAEICAFTDPQEALRAFVAEPSAFDLVVTDRTMPGLDGLELAARLRACAPDVRVILATGQAWDLTPKIIRMAGLAEVLCKPFNGAELMNVVRSVINRPECHAVAA